MSWLEQQNTQREDYENEGLYQRKLTIKSILCNRFVKGWTILTIFAAAVPILMYYFIINRGTYRNVDTYTCLVQSSFRVPCGKANNVTSEYCDSIKCCFNNETKQCYHYLPSRYSYDFDENLNEYVSSQNTSPFETNSVDKLYLTVNEISSDKVSVIFHQENISAEGKTISENKNYIVNLANESLIVEIFRNNGKELLLSTAKGPLIASENYWELTLYLTNNSLFGLDKTLIQVNENSTLRKVIYKNKNDHYTLPVFWAYANEQFHGIVIKHEGPLEILILPSHLIILRSLTGGSIELELSVGPTPKLLHDQQTETESLPPYWVVEPHECRRTNNLNATELIEKFTVDEQVQTYCIDENLVLALMNDNLTNVDILNDTLTKLNKQGKKFLLSFPPHILVAAKTLYEKADSLGIIYRYNNSQYKGKYLNQEVVYPNYDHSEIQIYMKELFSYLNAYIGVPIDGFILTDDWPVDEKFKMNGSDFPYISKALQDAMSYTIRWNATTNDSFLHIQKHNSYGASHIEAFKNYYASSNPAKLIMASSKNLGQTQPTIIQNVDASWSNLKMHIQNLLFSSISGNHLVNLPVCGDTSVYNSSFQETLCIRWYLVAATMPMFRVSSPQPWRDSASLSSKFAQNLATYALEQRKMLLPFYYTILSKKEPVLRPMFYDFYENTTTFSMTSQYMIGENILVAHPLSSDRTKLEVYLPSRIAVWYEFSHGDMYNTTKNPWIDIDVREGDFLAFVAQGNIIPLKEDNQINLIVALNCTASSWTASGTLLQDDYINFTANNSAVNITNIPTENCNSMLGYIKLYHYVKNVSVYNFYDKNEDLCTGTNSISISYETLTSE